ncbi:hypothetical protein FV219_09290 [Methylobacterium sp. WL122]|nr:hypothetical protein FV219_09290 [Methylobacterium sp. WL122]
MADMPDWRRQVSQDAEVTKGALRIAWLLAEHRGFAQHGCTLDNVAIGAATDMKPRSVANAIVVLRGLGHIACRGIMVDGKSLRLIRATYHRVERDGAISDLDRLESPIISPSPDLSVPDPIIPEPASQELNVALVSELSCDAVTPAVERVDPGSVSSSVPMFASRECIRHPDNTISTSWPSSSDDAWERDLTGFKIPLRCQHVACDRPTACLCLETHKGFCRRHQKHARIPAPLSFSALSEL